MPRHSMSNVVPVQAANSRHESAGGEKLVVFDSMLVPATCAGSLRVRDQIAAAQQAACLTELRLVPGLMAIARLDPEPTVAVLGSIPIAGAPEGRLPFSDRSPIQRRWVRGPQGGPVHLPHLLPETPVAAKASCRGTVVIHIEGTRTCASCAAGGRTDPVHSHQHVLTCPGCPLCFPEP
jgi:hypothetical protein